RLAGHQLNPEPPGDAKGGQLLLGRQGAGHARTRPRGGPPGDRHDDQDESTQEQEGAAAATPPARSILGGASWYHNWFSHNPENQSEPHPSSGGGRGRAAALGCWRPFRQDEGASHAMVPSGHVQVVSAHSNRRTLS